MIPTMYWCKHQPILGTVTHECNAKSLWNKLTSGVSVYNFTDFHEDLTQVHHVYI